MADGAPMSDGRVWVTLEVHPAGQGITGLCHQKPTVPGTEASDELISHW